ncbi:MAG: hypothetical protein ACSW8E_01235 [Clostridia bacterium]
MRSCSRSRALSALILSILLLGLCACSYTVIESDSAPNAAPEQSPEPALQGRWTASVDIGGDLSSALGFDLRPWLRSPLRAELRLEIGADGACTLTRDEGVCADTLREALAACLRELQERESGESLGGLALAEALGADPQEFAAALCDELLPPPAVTAGRYDGSSGEIRWNGGAVSPVRREGEALRFAPPAFDEMLFSPADQP